MSVKDVLDQAEIDALLNSSDDDLDDEIAESEEGLVRSFDFTAQDRIIRGRMPGLDMVNERLLRALRVTLFNMLRRTPEVELQGVRYQKFSEYMHTLYVPTSINIVKMTPLRGNALLVFDAKLIYIFVDNFFGGGGRYYNKIEGREFTVTETRIIEMLMKSFFKDCEKSWEPLTKIQLEKVGAEINPSMINILTPSDLVIINSFRIELEGGGGEIHLTLPFSMIEPIRYLLDAECQMEGESYDAHFSDRIKKDLMKVNVHMDCVLAEKEMSLKDVEALEEGSVIPIEMGEDAVMTLEGIPKYTCRFGTSNDHYALQMKQQIPEE